MLIHKEEFMYNSDDYLNFSLSPHRRPLFEADDDEAEAGGEGNNPPAETNQGNAEETQDANNEEEAPAEEQQEENPDEEPPEEDFNIEGGDEDEEGEEGDEEGGDEEPAEEPADPGEVALGDNPDYTDPNIENEKEIYDSLSPEEQQMKDKNLRKQYADLYTNINQITDKLDSISTEMEDINLQIKRLLMILYEYKQLIHDYFSNLYNSKSYIENLQNYEKYKLFLYGIKNIIDSIDNVSDKDK